MDATQKQQSTADRYHIVEGDWVVAGEGQHADIGEILSVEACGEIALVAWRCGRVNYSAVRLADDDVLVFEERRYAQLRFERETRTNTV